MTRVTPKSREFSATWVWRAVLEAHEREVLRAWCRLHRRERWAAWWRNFFAELGL